MLEQRVTKNLIASSCEVGIQIGYIQMKMSICLLFAKINRRHALSSGAEYSHLPCPLWSPPYCNSLYSRHPIHGLVHSSIGPLMATLCYKLFSFLGDIGRILKIDATAEHYIPMKSSCILGHEIAFHEDISLDDYLAPFP